jgi:hypothetical protein
MEGFFPPLQSKIVEDPILEKFRIGALRPSSTSGQLCS